MSDKKLGLVLEGGGARGAYQAGAIVMFDTLGYAFNAVAGTSIGALNGSMYAQKTFERSYDLWNTLNYSEIFDFDNNYAANLVTRSYDFDTLEYTFKKVRAAIANKGFDTKRLRNIIKSYIDEDKLRASDIEFGLMTVSLTDRTPCPIFVKDIPDGMVAEYVMASASLPIFDRTIIDDKLYVDGGFYDNMPINMLIDKGYKDLIAIQTMSKMRTVKCKDDRAQILNIIPSEKPGKMLDLTPKTINRAITMGKFDVVKYLGGFVGEKYYIDVSNVSPFGYGLCDMSYETYVEIANIFELKRISKSKSVLIKEITSEFSKRYKRNFKNIADALIFFLEFMANLIELNEMVFYDIRILVKYIADNVKKLYTARNVSQFEKVIEKLNQKLNLSEIIPESFMERIADRGVKLRKCEKLIMLINFYYFGEQYANFQEETEAKRTN